VTDTPPDHLSLDPQSRWFDEAALRRGVGIRFKGRERTDVEEYSISEGWIRVQAGKSMDRRGRPLTIKLSGEVEPYFTDAAEAGGEEGAADAGGAAGGEAGEAAAG
jgi:hypothetical protein